MYVNDFIFMKFNSRWKINTIILILLVTFILCILYVSNRLDTPKLTSKSTVYKTFYINIPPGWTQTSHFYQPNQHMEDVRLVNKSNNNVVDVYINVSDQKFEEYDSALPMLIRFSNARYIETTCGGGKAMDSNCGTIIFPYFNRWYRLGYFDYYGKTGMHESKKMLLNILSSFNPKI